MDIDIIANRLAESCSTLLFYFYRLRLLVDQGTQNEEEGTKLQLTINDATWDIVATATRLQKECNHNGDPSEVRLAETGERMSVIFVEFLNNRGGSFEVLEEALAEFTGARQERQEFKKMAEEPKRVIHTARYFERIEGGYHEHNYTQKQDLAEAAAEIQKLLDHLFQTYPHSTEATLVQAIKVEIKNNPTLKVRLINALKSGGVETLKAIFNHPFVSVPVETIKGFLEAEAD